MTEVETRSANHAPIPRQSAEAQRPLLSSVQTLAFFAVQSRQGMDLPTSRTFRPFAQTPHIRSPLAALYFSAKPTLLRTVEREWNQRNRTDNDHRRRANPHHLHRVTQEIHVRVLSKDADK